MPTLSVNYISKTYKSPASACGAGREIPVLSKIVFEVKPREFVSIIGRNGSGKSTLLKIIAGVVEPTSGTFTVDGNAAYMPQDHTLLPWRTVEDNLLLPGDIQNISRGAARARIQSLLAEFGLDQYVGSYPSLLSGGTRQKIALLRTVIQKASILLLDEPFAMIDALTRLESQTWLQAFVRKNQASALLVTHDMQEAIFLSDTIYVLDSGNGDIKEKFTVPLSRPRLHEHLHAPEALALEKTLFSLLVE